MTGIGDDPSIENPSDTPPIGNRLVLTDIRELTGKLDPDSYELSLAEDKHGPNDIWTLVISGFDRPIFIEVGESELGFMIQSNTLESRYRWMYPSVERYINSEYEQEDIPYRLLIDDTANMDWLVTVRRIVSFENISEDEFPTFLAEMLEDFEVVMHDFRLVTGAIAQVQLDWGEGATHFSPDAYL